MLKNADVSVRKRLPTLCSHPTRLVVGFCSCADVLTPTRSASFEVAQTVLILYFTRSEMMLCIFLRLSPLPRN